MDRFIFILCLLLLSGNNVAVSATLKFTPMPESVGIINYKVCYSAYPGVFDTCEDLGVGTTQSDGRIWVEVDFDDGKWYVSIINCTLDECGDPSSSYIITEGAEKEVFIDSESDYNGDGKVEYVMKTEDGTVRIKLSPFMISKTKIWVWDYVLTGRGAGKGIPLLPNQDVNFDGFDDLSIITPTGTVLSTPTFVNSSGSIWIGGWDSSYTVQYSSSEFNFNPEKAFIRSCDFDGDGNPNDRIFINEFGVVGFDHTADGLNGIDQILLTNRGSSLANRHLVGHMDAGMECDLMVIIPDGTAAIEHREDGAPGFNFWEQPFMGDRGAIDINQHQMGDLNGDGINELIIKTPWEDGLAAFSWGTPSGTYGPWIGIGSRGAETRLMPLSDWNGDGRADIAIELKSKEIYIDYSGPNLDGISGLSHWERFIVQ